MTHCTWGGSSEVLSAYAGVQGVYSTYIMYVCTYMGMHELIYSSLLYSNDALVLHACVHGIGCTYILYILVFVHIIILWLPYSYVFLILYVPVLCRCSSDGGPAQAGPSLHATTDEG